MFAIARAPTLEIVPWHQLTKTLDHVIRMINATGAIICGRYGEGLALLDDATICFNGNLAQRQWWKAQGRPRLCIEIDDAHEDLMIPRSVASTTGTFHHDLITQGKPYTIAVRSAYLLMRHYYPEDTRITAAPGTLDDWFAAWRLVRLANANVVLPPECMHITRTTRIHARHGPA